ncbi:MAG: dTDP-4-dehydrorhamnose 3,5-epimerase [Nitrospirae bacterium]|nr:MAG: dTDP-4-dehydrorhamnose 3,5-epimerase [Nitrospirota bacterium]
MNVYSTSLPEVVVIEPDVHRDTRGFFLESYHARKYAERGIPAAFVQDNHSQSVRGTLRGLHAQLAKPQGKLVRVIRGEIVDVAVDIRRGSPSFGSWVSVTLSSENFLQVYIPPGFAHGFCVVSEVAEVEYKCTDFYEPVDQISIRWDDPALGIRWPLSEPILSDKDRDAPLLSAWLDRLPYYREPWA